MIIQKDFLNKLRDDVLESLEKKGFIIVKLGKPIKYIAVHPSEVLDRVKNKIKDDAKKQTEALEHLRDGEVLQELNVLHTQGVQTIEPTDLAGAVKGRTNIYNHLYSMIKDAKESIVLMTTEDGLVRKAEILMTAFEKAKKNGAKIKIAAPITKKTQPLLIELSKIAQVKHIDDIRARFCVIDSKEVAFFLLDDKEIHPTYDVGVWANTPFFAKALERIFSKVWKDYPASP
ncbi:hypothetical protein J4457_05020 [Candidatus Woesearchaeota archaeon]|nr:hypothetical protein [Candidatus Woesearchaeota archaeon]